MRKTALYAVIMSSAISAFVLSPVWAKGAPASAQALTQAPALGAPTRQDSAPVATAEAVAVQASSVTLQEGSEFELSLEQDLSSKTSNVGDRFRLALVEPLNIGGVTIPAGYSAVGEVTWVSKSGFIGKSGELIVQIKYLVIGDVRVPLRTTFSQKGKGNIGASVAVAVLVNPLGLLIKGKNSVLEPGRRFVTYVDQKTEIPLPLPPVPAS